MSTYHAWYLSLGGFLMVASPGSAHAQKDVPVKMVYAVWHDTTGAQNAVKHMSKGAKDQIEAYAVVIKDKAGKVEPRLRHHKAGSAKGLQATETIDSAIVRLSIPADSVSGYVAGGQTTTRLSEDDLKKVVRMFGPGESALLLISPNSAVSEIKKTLGMGAEGHPEIIELEVK